MGIFLMSIDLQNLYWTVAIVVGLLTILGTVFGSLAKAGHSFANAMSSLFKARPPVGVIEVPTKTVILIPVTRQNALWWGMGSMDNQPMMQIVGDLHVTNISKVGVILMGARMRKPKATGHALVSSSTSRAYSQKNVIPVGSVSDLRFDFYVQPPVREKGELFKADIAIIDQFGNEHWLKGLEFPYLG